MLYGIIPPLVTPFDDRDEIDEDGLRAEVQFMLNCGVHGLAVCGSTGEGYTLLPDETRRIVEIAIDEVRNYASRVGHPQVPIIVGIIANSTRQALQHAISVRDLPVAALMVTPPHYLFTPSEAEMFAYFRAISEETGLPVIVYNVVPWAYLSADALVRLMTETNKVIGVKQSAGDLHALAWLLANLPEGKFVLTAVDDLLYPSFLLGAHGAIAGICTAAPKLSVQLWDAVKSGEHDLALNCHLKLLNLWRFLNAPNFPARVKAALILQGVPVGQPRRPLKPITDEEISQLRSVLKDEL
ncbi:MAG: dihydrodipicolinate synthase family protein [Armatimonadetes bacterium]|nr:dihydrodipicolinate synthase family protein [Armatimonadota bacterium]MDW8028940.1 dihydrodipicolinate synthase family protein [Armatimonadota bacterium]